MKIKINQITMKSSLLFVLWALTETALWYEVFTLFYYVLDMFPFFLLSLSELSSKAALLIDCLFIISI